VARAGAHLVGDAATGWLREMRLHAMIRPTNG